MTIRFQDIFAFSNLSPATKMPLIDSHCHLQFPEFDQDRDQVVLGAKRAGLQGIVCVATKEQDSFQAIKLAQKHSGYIYATIGNHPYNADQSIKNFETIIEENSDHIVAVGETGLDYYRSPIHPNIQKESFRNHCLLAVKYNLPIIIHLREFNDCYEDAKQILMETKVKKAIFHCFSGNIVSAKEIWSNNWKTSFALNTFYPKNKELLEIFKQCPPHLKLIETDSPYLPPFLHRGQRNSPEYLEDIVTMLHN